MDIPEVTLSEVRKAYGRHSALRGVSATLSPGQLSLLLGPNGAGKSTLLTILSTLSRPSSGAVRYGERDHAYAERHLRGRIALVAHAPMLYRRMTGRENLLFFARMYRLRRSAELIAHWLDQVGLTADADRPMLHYSRGMVQRLALARALMPDPDLVLMDEPFTGLDDQATALLRRLLSVALTAGKIVVMTTHDLEAVDGLCRHLLILKQGKIAADDAGSPLSAASLRERYHAAL